MISISNLVGLVPRCWYTNRQQTLKWPREPCAKYILVFVFGCALQLAQPSREAIMSNTQQLEINKTSKKSCLTRLFDKRFQFESFNLHSLLVKLHKFARKLKKPNFSVNCDQQSKAKQKQNAHTRFIQLWCGVLWMSWAEDSMQPLMKFVNALFRYIVLM